MIGLDKKFLVEKTKCNISVLYSNFSKHTTSSTLSNVLDDTFEDVVLLALYDYLRSLESIKSQKERKRRDKKKKDLYNVYNKFNVSANQLITFLDTNDRIILDVMDGQFHRVDRIKTETWELLEKLNKITLQTYQELVPRMEIVHQSSGQEVELSRVTPAQIRIKFLARLMGVYVIYGGTDNINKGGNFYNLADTFLEMAGQKPKERQMLKVMRATLDCYRQNNSPKRAKTGE